MSGLLDWNSRQDRRGPVSHHHGGTGRRPLDGHAPDAVLPALDGLPALFKDAGWF
jgi:hypothetical protein